MIISGAYQLVQYNIVPAAKGIYFVVIYDNAGKMLGRGQMLVH